MPVLRLIIPVLIFILAAHGAHVYAPWLHFPGAGADGFKNLFTFAWYTGHNTTLIDFEGMAWPYGEHIFYTDQLPFWSVLFRPIIQFFGLQSFAAPLLLLIMYGSWLLAPLPLYKISKHFGVSTNIAIAGAVGYTLLAPQVARADGHYALAFILALPLVWWLLIRLVRDSFRWSGILLLAVTNLILITTHAYLGMMTIAFSVLFLGAIWLSELREWRLPLAGFLGGGLPAGCFLILLRSTDSHLCRTDNPHGFFDYTSSVNALFLPQSGPLSQITTSLNRLNHWEGHAYIGISAGVLLFSFLFWGINAHRNWRRGQASLLIPSLLAATALFFLAMGQPFAWVGLHTLDRFPLIKAFRGIGRFAWPMYFVLTATAVYLLDVGLKKLARPVAHSLAVAFFFIVVVEASYLHRDLRATRTEIANPFAQPADDISRALAAFEGERFDALIPLPFFHIGSESYGVKTSEAQEALAMEFSFQSGIPLVAARLTRTSIIETRQIMQLLAPPGYDRDLASTIPADSRFLLINDGSEHTSNSDAHRLWHLGTPVFESERFSLRSLDFGTLINREINDEQMTLVDYNLLNERRFEGSLSHVYGDFAPLGGWVGEAPCDAYTMLFDQVPDSTWLNRSFEARVWFKANESCDRFQNSLYAFFIAQTSKDKVNRWVNYMTPKMSHRSVGDWIEATVWFTLDELPDCLQIFIQGEPGCVDTLIIDDFTLWMLPENNE